MVKWICGVLIVGGCGGNPIYINSSPDGSPSSSGGGTDMAVLNGNLAMTARQPRNKVDILVMVDNSPSMAPKQAELQARFPQLIKQLDDFAAQGHPAWYHIAVVTSDLGAGQFTLGAGQCHPGGDGGKLQRKGVAAAMSCGDLGPDTSTNLVANYIDYDQIHAKNNLPVGQDLPTTFTCMASVGQMGCGYEAQLESAYDALKGIDEAGQPILENQGFLRGDDALLVVAFLTDEDDCSAPPDTDLFDPNKASQSGPYGTLLSYRCSQYGIQCGNPAKPLPYTQSGPFDDCTSQTLASGGKLYDVSRFVNFFTRPKSAGGLKADPRDVILAAITAPESSVQTILANANPQPPGPYVPCAGPPDGTANCAVVLQHSCVAPTNTNFFGDPAVRLNFVVDQAAQKQKTSICDTDYSQAITELGALIISNVGTPSS